jgi:hypothetical protein
MACPNDEVERMIAAAAANPVGAKLLELIYASSTAADLNRISTCDIPEAEGISEEEREALQRAVGLRFCMINAAAMAHRDKPRWDLR